MKLKTGIFVCTSVLIFLSNFSFSQQWQLKKAPLMTKYGTDINPSKVLAEYPRPQLVREKWLNLNGIWQFEVGKDSSETLPKRNFSRSILVPFPVESALSGIMEHHDRIWYKRKFKIPKDWMPNHVLLHFGAVDYETEVFINGKSIGKHSGGYDPFNFDISKALKPGMDQEIAVRVFDPTDKGGFPRGKQTLNPRGILYTSVTGIWQTVWLEPVAPTSIENIKIVPDIDQSVLKLTVNSTSSSLGQVLNIKIKEGNKVIKLATGKPNVELTIPISQAKLWSPDSPFLYNLEISLVKAGQQTDAVSSYFGMRKISVQQVGEYKKLFLNNKFLFQLGPLDQGFWPDGIYTAPSDEALKYDIEMIKRFGFNMVRKHIKVEPYRWYYWADKLGLMVWQDMPSPNSYTEHAPPVDTAVFASELTRLVKTHWNSPCIVTWVIFNEGQGQQNTARLVQNVHLLDPTRLINQASGGEHIGVGDFMDIHSYPDPAYPSNNKQVLACGEYGGIGYKIKGHLWNDGFGYIMAQNEADYTQMYNNYTNDLTYFKTNKGLSAAVYTELTDVEIEINGLMTYDRKVIKGAEEKIKSSNTNVIKRNLFTYDILPSSKKEAKTWKYTFTKPDTMWSSSNFKDENWQEGKAGFGNKLEVNGPNRTLWKTKDIWMRQDFTCDSLSEKDKNNLSLYIHYNNCEVYINGKKVVVAGGHSSGYTFIPISPEGKQAIHLKQKNVIAIHCHQDEGDRAIDAGICVLRFEDEI